MNSMIKVHNVCKKFILHNQSGIEIDVLNQASFEANKGECIVLNGQSGSGKSTLLRALYGNYLVDKGSIEVCHDKEWFDITKLSNREMLMVRKNIIGWVSQFLRVIPRISTLDVVMLPMLELGGSKELALKKAKNLLTRLNVPSHLWNLAHSTFSGGEQQRVNIARGFIIDYPILLLDEPTASLDSKNSEVVVELINEAKQRGSCVIGIFHDEEIRKKVADSYYDMKPINNL